MSQETLLAFLVFAGMVVMWTMFWIAYIKVKDPTIMLTILESPIFLKTVTVIGVVAVTGALAISERLESSATGAILSGIVGYVLGQCSPAK